MNPFWPKAAVLLANAMLLARAFATFLLPFVWALTLEVRENHRLVTEGVYRSVRHPMYTALVLFSIGQVLVLPNWVAGPAYLVAMAVMTPSRLSSEERLMLDTFGADYDAYRARTKRLLPGVW